MKGWVLVGMIFLLGCGPANDTTITAETVTVACAANMQYAMDSIAVVFELDEGVECNITSGSSGMLAAQIENGAPYDLFISADLAYPQAIYEKGNGDQPFTYAKGRLVFVYNKESSYESIEAALKDLGLSRIGLADTRLAPYGIAADQYLIKSGFKDGLEERLIIGESIGQINQYLTTGSVDAAFTSYSFRIDNEDRFGFIEVDPNYFDPIEQGAVVLNHGKNENNGPTEKLKTFLSSAKCKAILVYFGYLVD